MIDGPELTRVEALLREFQKLRRLIEKAEETGFRVSFEIEERLNEIEGLIDDLSRPAQIH